MTAALPHGACMPSWPWALHLGRHAETASSGSLPEPADTDDFALRAGRRGRHHGAHGCTEPDPGNWAYPSVVETARARAVWVGTQSLTTAAPDGYTLILIRRRRWLSRRT